jgi:hypothetical protein
MFRYSNLSHFYFPLDKAIQAEAAPTSLDTKPVID